MTLRVYKKWKYNYPIPHIDRNNIFFRLKKFTTRKSVLLQREISTFVF